MDGFDFVFIVEVLVLTWCMAFTARLGTGFFDYGFSVRRLHMVLCGTVACLTLDACHLGSQIVINKPSGFIIAGDMTLDATGQILLSRLFEALGGFGMLRCLPALGDISMTGDTRLVSGITYCSLTRK